MKESGFYIVHPEGGSWELPWLADLERVVTGSGEVEVAVTREVVMGYEKSAAELEWEATGWGTPYEEAVEWGWVPEAERGSEWWAGVEWEY